MKGGAIRRCVQLLIFQLYRALAGQMFLYLLVLLAINTSSARGCVELNYTSGNFTFPANGTATRCLLNNNDQLNGNYTGSWGNGVDPPPPPQVAACAPSFEVVARKPKCLSFVFYPIPKEFFFFIRLRPLQGHGRIVKTFDWNKAGMPVMTFEQEDLFARIRALESGPNEAFSDDLDSHPALHVVSNWVISSPHHIQVINVCHLSDLASA